MREKMGVQKQPILQLMQFYGSPRDIWHLWGFGLPCGQL